jgi:hypothetical protein
MPVAAAPAIDPEVITATVRARLDHDPHLAALRDAYLTQLTPERWTIEWHLPRWVARRLGLPDEVATALVESNVLGLLAVRLTDDVLDGDINRPDVNAARALSTAAFDTALGPYRELFPPTSPFWPFFERSMAAWRAGADGPDHATRAAPIKVAAHACCLLAKRMDLWPDLEACLDRAMTALVLYDQFFDWEADLAAGRWNAFIASAIGDERVTKPARARAAVLTAMLSRDVVAEHFHRIAVAAEAAARLGDALELDELASYLRGWTDAAIAQGEEIADHYRRAGEQATRLLFPHGIGMHTGGGQR